MRKDLIKINEMDLELENKIYLLNGQYMLPLVEVGEGLGYRSKVEEKSVELVKGPLWHLISLGDRRYNFARMLIELQQEPVLKEDIIYVPLDFFSQVLKVDLYIEDNILNFKV